ncbi:MAG: peptidylprolyl isomerase [Acidobacteria bacterium]|nr:peptidylprolyl isomerase [Acidobacteriota bacterium]
MKMKWALLAMFFVCAQLAAQTKGRVVEEIVARVNNEIITSSELQRAQSALHEEIKQDCPNCTPQQLQMMQAEKEKNLLRDLIDQSLLTQRAKDMGISVESEIVKRLDQIRQQNNIATMEDLERKINEQGLNFEDFKNNIRSGMLTQEVIRREVGSKVIIGRDETEKYYNEHKNDFQRPEQVALREIFVSTEGKKEEEIPELEKKAKNLLERVKKGEDFGELAKRYSDGSTANRGGELGLFERGQLSKELEAIVFKLNRNQMTDVVRTKTGFLVLQVLQRYEAGLQPLDKVEGEISNRLFAEKMEPGLRRYLQDLRRESYVVVKPGYTDAAAVASTPIQEVAAVPDEEKPKKGKRSFPLIGKRKKAAQ